MRMTDYTQTWEVVSIAGNIVTLHRVRPENTPKAAECVQCFTRHFPQVLSRYCSSYASASKLENFLSPFQCCFSVPYTLHQLHSCFCIKPTVFFPTHHLIKLLQQVNARPVLHHFKSFHGTVLSSQRTHALFTENPGSRPFPSFPLTLHSGSSSIIFAWIIVFQSPTSHTLAGTSVGPWLLHSIILWFTLYHY